MYFMEIESIYFSTPVIIPFLGPFETYFDFKKNLKIKKIFQHSNRHETVWQLVDEIFTSNFTEKESFHLSAPKNTPNFDTFK